MRSTRDGSWSCSASAHGSDAMRVEGSDVPVKLHPPSVFCWVRSECAMRLLNAYALDAPMRSSKIAVLAASEALRASDASCIERLASARLVQASAAVNPHSISARNALTVSCRVGTHGCTRMVELVTTNRASSACSARCTFGSCRA